MGSAFCGGQKSVDIRENKSLPEKEFNKKKLSIESTASEKQSNEESSNELKSKETEEKISINSQSEKEDPIKPLSSGTSKDFDKDIKSSSKLKNLNENDNNQGKKPLSKSSENQMNEDNYVSVQRVDLIHDNNVEINYDDDVFESEKVSSSGILYPKEEILRSWKNLIEKTLLMKFKLKSYALSGDITKLNELSELVQFLLASPAENSIEKVWVVYLWITHNINYDFEGYKNQNYEAQDAETVVKTGKAICTGYVNLFTKLCEALEITCVSITGYSKAYGYNVGDKFDEISHKWNAVKIDDIWYHIESTWGAGYCDDINGFVKKFDPYYFFTPPEIFIYEHFPKKSKYQFLTEIIDMEQFELLPYYRPRFFLYGFKPLTSLNCIIEPQSSPFSLYFESSDNTIPIGHLENLEDGTIVEDTVFIQKDTKTNRIEVDVAPQSNERNKLCVFACTARAELYDGVCEFLVLQKNILLNSEIFCSKYHIDADVYLHKPKQKRLEIKKTYAFKVSVEAFKVALIDANKSFIYFEKLNETENVWFLKHTPEVEGELRLSVKSNEESSFKAAFGYQVCAS